LEIFELYISPPKTVLSPATIVKRRQTEGEGDEHAVVKIIKEWNSTDLLSLNLVPAAILNLNWKKERTTEKEEKRQVTDELAVGRYLKADLLQQYHSLKGSSSSHNTGSSLSVFQGIPLVEKKKEDVADGKTSGGKRLGGGDGGTGPAEGKKSSSGSKPKWFKL
jgi:hypothetical protein